MDCAETKKIMIIEDELEERIMLKYILEDEGYDCIEVSDEGTAVDLVQFHHPDLIIIDRIMPKRNGMEICIEIKSRLSTSQIPIIMVTAVDKIEEKVEAFEEGVDDYITKPYAPRELVARVKAILRSSQEAIDRNPTTVLPGPRALEEEIKIRLDQGKVFAMCHADLDNFKPYADSHGFSLANDVIKWTGRMISEVVEKVGDCNAFVSHVGGDDFIIVCSIQKYEEISRTIIGNFDEGIVKYFEENELSKGYYIAKNRAGEEARFPIMTISIGVISNEKKKYENSTEMGIDLSTAKRKAKGIEKSNYYFWDPLETGCV